MIRIRSQIPGRIRIRVDRKDVFKDLLGRITGTPGLTVFATNPSHGSVVIHYDTAEYSAAELRAMVRLLSWELRGGNQEKLIQAIYSGETSPLPVVLSATGLLLNFILPGPFRLGIALLNGLPILFSGAKDLMRNGVTSHFMEAFAIGLSIWRRDTITASITSFLLNSGEYLESTLSKKSDDLLKSLLQPEITQVWKEINGQLEKVPFAEIQGGDTIVVHAGEMIPIDGVVLEGEASVNQSSMTGESVPVRVERGHRVLSGTVLLEGRIKTFAEQVGENTAMSRISKYIESALSNRSQTELDASRIADQLVPVTLLLSGLSYLINGKPEAVSSVLQADFSCALKLSTPVAFKSSIYGLGKNGVLVKDGKALESLAKIDTIIFDKTGTLTEGQLTVEKVLVSPDSNLTPEELLNLVASVEEHYFHPIAEAIVLTAREKNFRHFHHSDVEFIAGHGVYTTVNQKRLVIGSEHYLKDHEKISFDSIAGLLKEAGPGYTILHIGMEGKALGAILMKDTIRADAATVIQELRSLGIGKFVLLSGDTEDRARSLGDQLGMDESLGQITPEEKANIVKEIEESGRTVAFVGDGINDGPALSIVDLGISMGSGAQVSVNIADIVLARDSLGDLVEARKLATRTMSLIKTNYGLSTGVNAGIILGAAGGFLPPSISSLFHNGITVGVILRSLGGATIAKNNKE